MEGWTAAPFVPDTDSLDQLRAAGASAIVTYHPSAVVRAVDDGDAIRDALVADVRRAAGLAI
jgi:hypothetical protein